MELKTRPETAGFFCKKIFQKKLARQTVFAFISERQTTSPALKMWYFISFFCILALLTAALYILFFRPFSKRALPITAEASSDAIAVRVANNTKSDIYLIGAGVFYKKYKIKYHGNRQFSVTTIYEPFSIPPDIDISALVCKYSSISFSLRNPPAGAAGIYIDFSRFPIENTSTAAYKKICSSEFPYRTVQRYSKSKENFYYRILQTLKICRYPPVSISKEDL